MKRFVLGCFIGGASTFIGLQYFKPNAYQGLNYNEIQTVNSYIHNHHLEKLLKQSLMNGYMQLNKAFLDYGMKLKLDGFLFYGTYFDKKEMEINKITKSRCIFSPKETLCGHPDIQHGGATATIADQNSGILAMLFSRQLCATAQLSVKYKKPVKRGQLYVWQGQIEKRQERKIFVKSFVKDLQTGIVCAEAQALMMTVQWEHKMAEVFKLLFKSESVPQKSQ